MQQIPVTALTVFVSFIIPLIPVLSFQKLAQLFQKFALYFTRLVKYSPVPYNKAEPFFLRKGLQKVHKESGTSHGFFYKYARIFGEPAQQHRIFSVGNGQDSYQNGSKWGGFVSG
ncbi:hypothetical protein H6B33_01565 [Gemmiger formicilis]|uniref:hypothetical protein n=1 Tax=Gemmiger formicilis TaxID=745368 RepID=UPI001957C352|nr:hypothetical protein [Gemmiger formicilis]MBM6914092.1 hypothetical protein [Gemmiger formicilis]